jgi:hypothetical protein
MIWIRILQIQDIIVRFPVEPKAKVENKSVIFKFLSHLRTMLRTSVCIRVVDPDLRISSESGYGSRVLMTKNLNKLQLKANLSYFDQKLLPIYLSLGLLKGRSSSRRSLQPYP